MSNELIFVTAAGVSALVSSGGCLITYYFTKKNTLAEIQSRQPESDLSATPQQRETLAQKRLESYLEFWAKTSPLSSECLKRMTPGEAQAIYDTLLTSYETHGFYMTRKTETAFQELRRVLRMLSRDEGKSDLLEQIWKAKGHFRWCMKEDLTIVTEPALPREMSWLEKRSTIE